MGVITRVLNFVFGDGRNVVRETAEVFRENTEAGAQRDYQRSATAIEQFGQEFRPGKRGWFDQIMDGVNRLPRPLLALGCLGLFISAMVDPLWFTERMLGLSLVPEPLWWLLGVVVSFYFGARHQVKGQEFQKSMAATLARAPQVIQTIETLRDHLTPGEAADAPIEGVDPQDNAAVADWRATQPT